MWTSDSYSCFLQKMLCLSYGLTSSMYPVGMKCINYYNNYQEFSASLLLGSGTQRRTIYLGVWLNPYSIDVFSFVEFRVTEVGVFLVGMPIGGRIFLRAEAELLCCWYVTYWFMQWNLCLGALCFTFCLVEGSTTTEIKHWVELFFHECSPRADRWGTSVRGLWFPRCMFWCFFFCNILFIVENQCRPLYLIVDTVHVHFPNWLGCPCLIRPLLELLCCIRLSVFRSRYIDLIWRVQVLKLPWPQHPASGFIL